MEQTTYMTKEQILNTIKELGNSQGFYSRLYANMMNAPEDQRDAVLTVLEDKQLTDPVDLILCLEQ